MDRRSLIKKISLTTLSPLFYSGNSVAQEKISRIIVGFPPGGGTDVAARLLAEKMRTSYPSGLIVENRPGAAARLAVDYVKNAPPDGSTMLFTTDFAMTIYPHSFRKLSYDPIKDFAPVAACAKTSLAFSVGPSVPESVKTIADFIAWSKANPTQAAYASTSAGATPHFTGLMFSKSAGISLLHVPYKGGAPALQDLMGGQIASSFNPVGEVIPQLKSGKIRVLATTGASRSKFLATTPTFVESGFKDVVAEVWLGVVMPSNTPTSVIQKTASSINEALKTPELVEAYSKFGMETMVSSPESFSALIRNDLAMWGPIIKASGFTAED
ncbi:Bug family tripartite tricarboxylate transporter substrate binding protein [Limnohabitans sp. Rim8]|uniref:Bug family tripartite tricarboxylate transporter substrate binding protein n=1 Tax=Limnohabitans sp. Rim8 TaxID=1100718 RepID=UPI001E5F8EB6|nr:Bug family tripartite tricarboxylate transporter substrate binding protein [Limnohabitans sp. Rim8]